MRSRIRPGVAAAVAALALPAFAGCGGEEGERQFSPSSFVSEINSQGAALDLGPVLTSTAAGVDVYEVRFANAAVAAPTGEDSAARESGAGSLLVLGDEDLARAEYERCEGAPSLTCFRAANAVLRFEELQPADQARLVTAMEALATG